ncbi:dTMP kinase [Candidatus Daviesbacteria bacterium]|nr:dTMP kinase [Candidatus Daviesbacteria bacterium]
MVEKGLFVVLEGIDNCGKTTQAGLLAQYLEGRGLEVIQTREPGGTEVGEEIRQVLLKPREEIMSPDTQALLFYAARQEFLSQVVKPNLEAGITVITDRFEPSTWVYQGYVQGVDAEFLKVLGQKVVTLSGCRLDLLVILDIPAEESFRRRGNVDNVGQDLIYEEQGLEFAIKVREGYLKYKEDHAWTVALLDGTLTPEEIHQKIVTLIKPNLILKGKE